jgi:hypothetical protein
MRCSLSSIRVCSRREPLWRTLVFLSVTVSRFAFMVLTRVVRSCFCVMWCTVVRSMCTRAQSAPRSGPRSHRRPKPERQATVPFACAPSTHPNSRSRRQQSTSALLQQHNSPKRRCCSPVHMCFMTPVCLPLSASPRPALRPQQTTAAAATAMLRVLLPAQRQVLEAVEADSIPAARCVARRIRKWCGCFEVIELNCPSPHSSVKLNKFLFCPLIIHCFIQANFIFDSPFGQCAVFHHPFALVLFCTDMQRVALLVLFAAVLCAADESIVQTASGTVQGVIDEVGGARYFLGIPFAQPPVGALRWAKPVPANPWNGVFNASTFGNGCIQKCGLPPGTCPETISEDCLNCIHPFPVPLSFHALLAHSPLLCVCAAK